MYKYKNKLSIDMHGMWRSCISHSTELYHHIVISSFSRIVSNFSVINNIRTNLKVKDVYKEKTMLFSNIRLFLLIGKLEAFVEH